MAKKHQNRTVTEEKDAVYFSKVATLAVADDVNLTMNLGPLSSRVPYVALLNDKPC